MGKSSLMVRSAAALRESGHSVAVIDLTEIGNNVTAAQWYRGLLGIAGAELGLEEELADFWRARGDLGPQQRRLAAIRIGVLAHRSSRIVIFVDEIDAVRSLAFSTDEFFAGIRQLYNLRSQDPELSRLTFCLLGVATPSDLIKDTRSTPFNIGRRIELNDFTETEAASLALGLGHDQESAAAILKQILHWTRGHPYLTQRLCRAVADENPVLAGPQAVDRLCAARFLSPRARERDDNLLFVREHILRSEADTAELLGLYRRVIAGKRVQDDEKRPAINVLRLSGIVRTKRGMLEARNPIYQTAFNRAWVRSNMPGAELRRQRLAFVRGLVAATLVGLVIIGVMGFLVLRLRNNRRTLEDQQRVNRRLLYAAHMNSAMEAWERADLGRATDLIEAHRPKPGEEDLRGFEWYYLWRLCHGYLREFKGHTGCVMSLAVSPDGKTLATASWDGTARMWDMATARELHLLQADLGHAFAVAFSPDGKIVATAGEDGRARLWDVATGQEVRSLVGHTKRVNSVAFSPDGAILASASFDKTVKLWAVSSGQEIATLRGHTHYVNCVAFSPDGRTLASAGWDNTIRFWDPALRAQKRVITEPGDVESVAFSPDGKLIAASGWIPIEVWNANTGRHIRELTAHRNLVNSVCFSSDGRLLLSAGYDGTARVWNVNNWEEEKILRGTLVSSLRSATFSRAGEVVTGGDDNIPRLWQVASGDQPDLLRIHQVSIRSMQFSPDGSILATAGTDKRTRLWDTRSWQQTMVLGPHTDRIWKVGFSGDGKLLVTSGSDRKSRLWDLTANCKPGPLLEGAAIFFPTDHRLALFLPNDKVEIMDADHPQQSVPFGQGKVLGRIGAISVDGKLLVTVPESTMDEVWDINQQRKLAQLDWTAGFAIAFSPDSRLMATGSDSGVWLWDVRSRQTVTVLRAHSVGCVAFSPDGNRLAACGADGTVKLWNVDTFDEVITLRGHTGPVYVVDFSPDGSTLATAGADDTVRLWRAAPRLDRDPRLP